MSKEHYNADELVKSTATPEKGVDRAFEYLKEHDDGSESRADIRRIRWKVDQRLLPLMFTTFFLQFLDKVAYNYAAVMGLRTDLGLVGNDYTNAATITYGAYIAAEVLSVFALQKIPAATWLGSCAVVWGIACAATAGCTNYQTLLIARVFLGLAEASYSPSLIALNSQWYGKDEQAARLNYLYLGLGFGQIIGGLASYGFQGIAPGQASLAGWRIMFLVFGAATLVLGVCLIVFIPRSPMHAKWLSDPEKTKLVKYLSINRTGIENYKFIPRQILETFMDPQVWILMLMVVCSGTSAGIGNVYSSTLISLLGFSSRRAALLNTPGGAVMIISTLFAGLTIRFRIFNRATAFCIVTSVGLIGACIIAFVPSPTPLHPNDNHGNVATLLGGLIIFNAQVPALAIQYSWAAANIAGPTKKAIVFSLIAGCFGVGSIVGVQSFQDHDLPSGYRPAKIATVATQIASMALALTLTAYYYWQNKKRAAMKSSSSENASEASVSPWEGMTDREDKLFRYSY